MKPGDHLVVPLFFGLSHHGICVGPCRIVHWDSGISGRVGLLALLLGHTRARIRETSLTRFANGRRPRIRRYRQALDPATVVARARSRVGERGYQLLTNNCEQLATWCKKGQHQSSQVQTARRQTLLVGTVALGAVIGHATGSTTTAVVGAVLGLIVWTGGLWLRGRNRRSALPGT